MNKRIAKLTKRINLMLEKADGQLSEHQLEQRLRRYGRSNWQQALERLVEKGQVRLVGGQVIQTTCSARPVRPERVAAAAVSAAQPELAAEPALDPALVRGAAERILHKLGSGPFSFSPESIRAYCWRYKDKYFEAALELLQEQQAIVFEAERVKLATDKNPRQVA